MITELSNQELQDFYQKYSKNPKFYLENVLGIKQTWELQDRLLESCLVAIKEHKPIYVASGHSLGKDYIASAISLWFLHSFLPSIVIQTAPTERQTKHIMWADTLQHWNSKLIDLGGKAFADPYLEIKKENWYLIGFTTKETQASEGGKFQGFHSPNVCVICTEAQSVEDIIYDQIDAVATSENCLVIYLGNPTRAKGRFAKGLKDKENNIVFNFSCLDSPNYKLRKEIIPGLASYAWVEDKRKRWGEDDPRWFGRVLGQVPEVSINGVFTSDVLNLAYGKHGMLAQYSDMAGVAVDVAGEGIDDNVIMSGKGGEVVEVWTKVVASPSELAIKSIEMCRAIKGRFIIVDCDGIGASVKIELDKMPQEYLYGINVIGFHGCSTKTLTITVNGIEKRVYANKRAEAAFTAKERIKKGKAAINKEDVELIEDLEADQYFEGRQGIQLLDKEDIKDELDGRSPGRGDCWKMLQYAFEQNYEDNTYKESGWLLQRNSQSHYAICR